MNRRTRVIFVTVTSVISIAVGFMAGIFAFDTATAVLLAILTQVIFLLVGAQLDASQTDQEIAEIQRKLSSIEERAPILNSMAGLISSRGRLSEVARQYLGDLSQLSLGHYTTRGVHPDLWDENIACMKFLEAGDWFRATCYIPADEDSITKLYGYRKYEEYCQLSYELPSRGINFSKIFLVHSRKYLEHEAFRNHLSRLQSLVDETAPKLRPANIRFEVYVLIGNEIQPLDIGMNIYEDYMIWGEKLVSVSETGVDSIVTKLNIDSSTENIMHYIRKFSETQKLALNLSEIHRNSES